MLHPAVRVSVMAIRWFTSVTMAAEKVGLAVAMCISFLARHKHAFLIHTEMFEQLRQIVLDIARCGPSLHEVAKCVPTS